MMVSARRLAACICAIPAVWPAVASANAISVRAGEHAGFTRLVLDIGGKVAWQFGRSAGGYELRLDAPLAIFDTSAVFDRIPRDRVSAVAPATTPGALALAVTCECHATASQTGTGRVVIDVADGKASPGSPFEVPIAPRNMASQYPIPPVSADRPALTQPTGLPGIAATLPFSAHQNNAASVPIYWRTPPSEPPQDAAPTGGPAPSILAADMSAQTATPEPEQILPTVFPPNDAPPITGAPVRPATPQGPDARVLATETELLHQLSRAAAQGLVKIDAAGSERTKKAGEASADAAAHAAAAPPGMADPGQKPEGVHAETGMDREAPDNPGASHMTPDGAPCVDDETFAVAKWGNDRPAAAQITEARGHLTGEFDKPDPVAVINLVKLYLFLGLGAEAGQALSAFGIADDQAPFLRDLGTLVDDRPVGSTSPLNAMRACDGAVALWAFLAAPSADDVRSGDTGVIVRAFSALPKSVRETLAARLSARLLQIGADDAARAVRNSLARSAAPQDRTVGLIDAEIALDQDRPAVAEAKLDQLSKGSDPLSTRASLLAVRSRIARGEPVEAAEVESIAALAFEYRATPEAQALAELEIEARGASGDFKAAFASFARWKAALPQGDFGPALGRLFDLLAAKAPDDLFLGTYFAQRDLVHETRFDPPQQLDLAARLAALGFAPEVRAVLDESAAATDRGRLLLARAALDLYDPYTALTVLPDVRTPEALALRAAAEMMLGDHRAAADAYERAGDAEAAGEAAWSAGDFARASTGPEPLRKAVETLGLARPPAPPAPADAPLTLGASKAALEESMAMRAALAEILGPAPALPPKPGG